MTKHLLLVFIITAMCFSATLAKPGPMIYKDPKQPLHLRIKDLVDRMTLDEKIGQMTLIDRSVASHDVMKNYFIGSLMSTEGSVPAEEASAETWINMVNDFQRGSLSTRLGIPMMYGTDVVHGNSNVFNATIFPHNIALGATRDPELVKKIGAATALEVRATGINYVFAPNVAVCRDPRWGRCLESYSEDPKIVRAMTTEIIPGLQGDIPSDGEKGVPYVGGPEKVAACAKHFVGDGGIKSDITEDNSVPEFRSLLRTHLLPFIDAIQKGVATIMVSDSSWNGVKMHQNKALITGLLKNTLKFRGFVVSDFKGIDKITDPAHANYTLSIEQSVGAGIDMVMVGYNYFEFIDGLTSLVKNNVIPMRRINDAVRRILRVKFIMGLFENPLTDLSMTKYLGHQDHRDLAREAVRKSLVLLKNGKSIEQSPLPIPKDVNKILVAGSHADNIGNQCGGGIEWQGRNGNIRQGTTILSAIKDTVDSTTEVVYIEDPDRDLKASNFPYGIVVIGEEDNKLDLSNSGRLNIMNVCDIVEYCVVVLMTGRPVVIEPYLEGIDSLVAAWYPGTEGKGVTDVLFGDYGFTGTLAHSWLRSIDQLRMNVGELPRDPLYPDGDPHYDPLYPIGYGLTQ